MVGYIHNELARNHQIFEYSTMMNHHSSYLLFIHHESWPVPTTSLMIRMVTWLLLGDKSWWWHCNPGMTSYVVVKRPQFREVPPLKTHHHGTKPPCMLSPRLPVKRPPSGPPMAHQLQPAQCFVTAMTRRFGGAQDAQQMGSKTAPKGWSRSAIITG